MQLNHKKLLLPMRRYYFECQRQPDWMDVLTPTAFLDCYRAEKPSPWFHVEQRQTLITDLTQDEASIQASFSKKTRNEINRYQRGSDYILDEDTALEDFIPAYNAFAELRGLSAFSMQEAEAFGRENLRIFSMGREQAAEIGDLYLFDRHTQTVHGLLSYSPIDSVHDNAAKRQISIARRYLLWHSIVYFKQAGFQVYDWGGYAPDSDNPVIRGISEFKSSFKGEVVPTYNYYSPPYRMVESLRTIIKNISAKTR